MIWIGCREHENQPVYGSLPKVGAELMIIPVRSCRYKMVKSDHPAVLDEPETRYPTLYTALSTTSERIEFGGLRQLLPEPMRRGKGER
jgi:hypothetical protein